MTALATQPRLSRTGIVLIGVLVVIAAVVALLVPALIAADREARYLAALDSSPVGDLPDEQLLISMRADCERIADGMDERERLEASPADRHENVRALWRAAVEVCG